jgi:hypothetical protein
MGTLLALFVVPVLHTYTDDLSVLVTRGVRRLARRRDETTAFGAGEQR